VTRSLTQFEPLQIAGEILKIRLGHSASRPYFCDDQKRSSVDLEVFAMLNWRLAHRFHPWSIWLPSRRSAAEESFWTWSVNYAKMQWFARFLLACFE
jgi:hypothetical protein